MCFCVECISFCFSFVPHACRLWAALLVCDSVLKKKRKTWKIGIYCFHLTLQSRQNCMFLSSAGDTMDYQSVALKRDYRQKQ